MLVDTDVLIWEFCAFQPRRGRQAELESTEVRK